MITIIDQKNFSEYVNVLAGKLQFFLIHRNKSRSSRPEVFCKKSVLPKYVGYSQAPKSNCFINARRIGAHEVLFNVTLLFLIRNFLEITHAQLKWCNIPQYSTCMFNEIAQYLRIIHVFPQCHQCDNNNVSTIMMASSSKFRAIS